ncbi:MAG TPA: metal-dependent hydrolase, partial [Luteolibacter sp.]|nr:metal-dependent hydrolase [Luteolibacter sp.]
MDSITQAALGAAVGEAMLGKKLGNRAMVWGAVFGTLPDLDVLVSPFLTTSGNLFWHRGPSHSLLVMILASIAAAKWLPRLWKKPKISGGLAGAFVFAVWSTHVLIDCFTVYGTSVLWPFSNARIGFNNLFIIDPFYTLPLLVTLVWLAFLRTKKQLPKRRRLCWWGLGLSSAYVALSFGAKQLASEGFDADLKRRGISYSRRLERLSADLGKGRLESSDVRVDGDLAGVLIRDTGGFDPSRMRVFAVALVKWKNHWLPAPLPASFENTAAGLSVGMRDQIAPLENWLLRSQITELERLRDESQQRMKREIAAAVDPLLLRSGEPKQIADAFLDACAKRNLPAVLGFLGGLQKNLPDDWAERLRSADAAIANGRKVGWPWRLVLAPEVVRVPVDDGGEQINPLFSFACLDPAGRGLRPSTPEVEILHIELNKDDEGLWKVDLPPAFLLAPGEAEDEAEDDFEQELLDSFPAGVRKINPTKPAASMEEATHALDQAFRADSLMPLFALMDLEGDPGTACRGCGLAAKSWWQMHHPDAARFAVPLGFHEQGKFGIAAFQFFSPRETNALDIRIFHFEKSKDGWLLIPGMRLTNSPADAQLALRTWADERTRTWKDKWQAAMLKWSPALDSIPEGNAPPTDDARDLVDRWLGATHASDIDSMLRMVAWTNRPGDASRTLQNRGY